MSRWFELYGHLGSNVPYKFPPCFFLIEATPLFEEEGNPVADVFISKVNDPVPANEAGIRAGFSPDSCPVYPHDSSYFY